jgi:predicted transcriptional regulator
MQGIEIDSTGIQLKDSSSDRLITSSRAWLEVGDIMSTNATTVSPDATIVSAVKTMSEKKISCIVVVADAKVVGILTETGIPSRGLHSGMTTSTREALWRSCRLQWQPSVAIFLSLKPPTS